MSGRVGFQRLVGALVRQQITRSRPVLHRHVFRQEPLAPLSLGIARSMSSGKSGKNGGDDVDDDPFGIHFEDGEDQLGPTIPPKYKRDATTGKFTGETESELTEKEKKMLQMDSLEEQEYILRRFLEDWDSKEDSDDGLTTDKIASVGERIRMDNIGTNVLGRSVQAQKAKSVLEGGDDGYSDPSGFSKPITPAEFDAFRKHMKKEYDVDVEPEDMPIENTAEGAPSTLQGYADNEYLNSKWLSSRAVRFMDDTVDDDPFADLTPSDLSPTKLVNRRKAKKLPAELLHHNNLALLRRYITPTGQIMNRMHSRLGARDQRKIAKLIKRARHMGLIPYAGQFAVEAHGNTKEKDIDVDNEWEQELKRRGLVIRKSKQA